MKTDAQSRSVYYRCWRIIAKQLLKVRYDATPIIIDERQTGKSLPYSSSKRMILAPLPRFSLSSQTSTENIAI